MEQKQKRKKRRHRLQKPDAVNIILASLAVVLVAAWGGLHWKDSSKSETVHASSGEIVYLDLDAPKPADPGEKDGAAGTDKLPPKGDGAAAPDPNASQTNEEPTVSGDGDSDTTAQPKPAQTADGATDKDKNTSNTGGSKPTSPAKPDPAPSKKPDVEAPSEGQGPSTPVTPPPMSETQQYEQEIIGIQAACTQEMNEVLVSAQDSMKELDANDPYAILAWHDQWAKALGDSGASCDVKFQGVVQNAEKAFVSTKVIEGWKQSYNTLMNELKSEFEAKLNQYLM